jgi:hypothetical protein
VLPGSLSSIYLLTSPRFIRFAASLSGGRNELLAFKADG